MVKPKVLVVDGSLSMRAMLKNQLESINCVVAATANDWKEAMVTCQNMQPDMALTDIAMAKVDNFTSMRALLDCGTKVIVMVPEKIDMPELVAEAIIAGASGYIRKPMSTKELDARTSGVLRSGK